MISYALYTWFDAHSLFSRTHHRYNWEWPSILALENFIIGRCTTTIYARQYTRLWRVYSRELLSAAYCYNRNEMTYNIRIGAVSKPAGHSISLYFIDIQKVLMDKHHTFRMATQDIIARTTTTENCTSDSIIIVDIQTGTYMILFIGDAHLSLHWGLRGDWRLK